MERNINGTFNRPNLVGFKNGMLTVLELAEIRKKGQYHWRCICQCGKETIVSSARAKTTKSCGCFRHRKGQNSTHGLRYHPMYRVWRSMKLRCLNKTAPNYGNYGGRGITICKEWITSFINFYNDMKDGYIKGLPIDRIDNNGNYCKDNCRWATNIQSQNNKRTNVLITHDGQTHTVAEWSRILNIKENTIGNRKRKGYSDCHALFGKRFYPPSADSKSLPGVLTNIESVRF